MAFIANGVKGAYNWAWGSKPVDVDEDLEDGVSHTSGLSKADLDKHEQANPQRDAMELLDLAKGLVHRDSRSKLGTPGPSLVDEDEGSDVFMPTTFRRGPSHISGKRAVDVLQVKEGSEAFKDAMKTIDNNTTAWRESWSYATSGSKGYEGSWGITRGVIAVLRFLGGIGGFLTFVGKHWANKANANRELLSNPQFTLPEHLQETENAANRAVEALQMQGHISDRTNTSFDDVLNDRTANHIANPMSAHGTVLADASSNSKADLIQAALKPRLKAWKEALEATGKNLDDNQYRALVAIATQKIADQLVGATAQNYVIDQSAALYGQTASDRIASTIANTMTIKSLTSVDKDGVDGVKVNENLISKRAALIATVTGRPYETIKKEIYTSLNANSKFIDKMQRFEADAVAKINGHRDLAKLQGDFLATRMEQLEKLAKYTSHLGEAGKGSGEEYLRHVLNYGGVEGMKESQRKAIFLNGRQGNEELVIQCAQEITTDFEEMFNFLDDLEGNFKAYVAQHEKDAQAELAQLANLRKLRYNTEENLFGTIETEDLDAELQEAGKIEEALDPNVEHEAISNENLGKIFNILIGDGTEKNPGAPTMADRFIDTLFKKGKVVFDEDAPEEDVDPILGLTLTQHRQIVKDTEKDLRFTITKTGGEQEAIRMQQFDEDTIRAIRIARGIIQAEVDAEDQHDEVADVEAV